jgi:hypothetical protein
MRKILSVMAMAALVSASAAYAGDDGVSCTTTGSPAPPAPATAQNQPAQANRSFSYQPQAIGSAAQGYRRAPNVAIPTRNYFSAVTKTLGEY